MSESPSVSVSTTETSPIRRLLAVEVSAARVQKAFDRAYRDLARSARVKGFRPGKTPRHVLEKLYGAGLAEEIERTLVNETLPEAVESAGIFVVAEPAIEAEPPQPNQVFRYRANLEVKPSIALPELGGLPATRPPVLVKDEEVQAELEQLRQRRAPVTDQAEDARAGDKAMLTIDYVGRIGGAEFEGGSAEGAVVEIGSGRMIPGFEDGLRGALVGEAREVAVTFPADYPAEDVRGKQAVFEVKVRKHQRREVPELDDAFVASLGDEAVASVSALRERLRDGLLKRAERMAEETARRSVVSALLERTNFEVPASLVQRRLSQRLDLAHRELAQLMPHEELHQRLDEWAAEWRPEAERDVRETLVLEAVADQEALAASDDEVDARIETMARDQGMAPERLRRAYDQRGLVDSLRTRLREEKALAFLLSTARVAETSGT